MVGNQSTDVDNAQPQFVINLVPGRQMMTTMMMVQPLWPTQR